MERLLALQHKAAEAGCKARLRPRQQRGLVVVFAGPSGVALQELYLEFVTTRLAALEYESVSLDDFRVVGDCMCTYMHIYMYMFIFRSIDSLLHACSCTRINLHTYARSHLYIAC